MVSYVEFLLFPPELCTYNFLFLFEICKDVDELRVKVQEARRVKMLHCPSKVDFIGLLCYFALVYFCDYMDVI